VRRAQCSSASASASTPMTATSVQINAAIVLKTLHKRAAQYWTQRRHAYFKTGALNHSAAHRALCLNATRTWTQFEPIRLFSEEASGPSADLS
jgi:hypothetical protein